MVRDLCRSGCRQNYYLLLASGSGFQESNELGESNIAGELIPRLRLEVAVDRITILRCLAVSRGSFAFSEVSNLRFS